MFERILTGSRYSIIIAVVGSLIASLVLLLYGGLEIIYLLAESLTELSVDGTIEKSLILTFIEVIDLFLLAAVFYIISVGLYELFINDRVDLPAWLRIHDFEGLKGKLISILVVVLSVIFLGQAANWDKRLDLLGFGAAVALVIAALAYFLGPKSKKNTPVSTTPDIEE
ncbi:MAG: YqhA family protein [Desulfobacteraceae bacterium]|nr:MAG: YqhA family protein [Desulfobacteraceae bacterium]